MLQTGAATRGDTVTRTSPSQTLAPINFIVGIALLVMMAPLHGEMPQKPAGVRTAIELISKKLTLRPIEMTSATAA